MDIPKENYVGQVQQKCQQEYQSLPVYIVRADPNDKLLKCTCTFKDWVSHGSGSTQMFAKQNAAKEMLKLINDDKLLPCTSKDDSSVGKSSKCNVDNFSATGRENPKKEAKEKQEANKEMDIPKENFVGHPKLLPCTQKNDSSLVKSPISKLQEEFGIKCNVDNFSASGRANSKTEEKVKQETNNEMDIPKENFIGKLQEVCQQAHQSLPVYMHPDSNDKELFKCTCTLKDWVSHGSGSSKISAKQNSAKEMLKLIDDGKLLPCTRKNDLSLGKSSICKLQEYCMKEEKDMPHYKELPQENGLFCIKCTVDNFSATGKASSKKEAKEKAAYEVAEHFNVHKYYDDLIKRKELNKTIPNAVQELHIFCQKNRLKSPTFIDHERKENNQLKYCVTCSVGDLKVESWAHSKKAAKHEAAALLLQALNNVTLKNSPGKTQEGNDDVNINNST